MTWGTDRELHKYPKGFKAKLIEYYGFNKPMCVLCWSRTNICIHHHIDVVNSDKDPVDKYSYAYQYRDGRTEPDWGDLSKFVLLCASCHSKIHSTINFSGVIDNKKAPILNLLDDVIKKYEDMILDELKKEMVERELLN